MAEKNEKNTTKTEVKKTQAKKPGFFAMVGKFFRNTFSEMKKVVWLSPKEVKKNTVLVIITVVIVSAFIYALDLTFTWAITTLGKLV